MCGQWAASWQSCCWASPSSQVHPSAYFFTACSLFCGNTFLRQFYKPTSSSAMCQIHGRAAAGQAHLPRSAFLLTFSLLVQQYMPETNVSRPCIGHMVEPVPGKPIFPGLPSSSLPFFTICSSLCMYLIYGRAAAGQAHLPRSAFLFPSLSFSFLPNLTTCSIVCNRAAAGQAHLPRSAFLFPFSSSHVVHRCATVHA